MTIRDTGVAPPELSGLRFTGQGHRSATLQIASNDPASPSTVSLSGTGGSLPQGPQGATGATGGEGPRGHAGQVELVTCKTSTKVVKGHRRTVRKCTTKLVTGPVKFTTSRAERGATVSRGGVDHATGVAIPTGTGRWQIVLTHRLRELWPGRYTPTLRARHGQGRIVERRRITIT